MTSSDIRKIIDETVFLLPNAHLLSEYLKGSNPRQVALFSNSMDARHGSATHFFSQNSAEIFYQHRHDARFIWATKPYPPLDDIGMHPRVTVLQNNSLIYRYLTTKLNQWNLLRDNAPPELSRQIQSQTAPAVYEILWKDQICTEEQRDWLFTGAYGNRGRSFRIGHQIGALDDKAFVYRGTKIQDYSIGLFQSGVIFENSVLPLPIGRMWNDSEENYLQCSCIYFDPNIDSIINKKFLNKITTQVGIFLRKFGFRGLYGVDYLYNPRTEEIFLCEYNPRYTGELRIYGLAGVDAASHRNPLNIHTLNILSFILPDPPLPAFEGEIDFEEIGGGPHRFTSLPHSRYYKQTDLKLGEAGYSKEAPAELSQTHTNARLISV